MNKILLSMAAVSAALAAGTPAAAQFTNDTYQDRNGTFQNRDGGNGRYGDDRNNMGADGNLSVRIQRLQARIEAGVRSGAITRGEAQPLRQQLRALVELERQYSVGGLTGQERSILQQRLRTLRQQVRAADGGGGQYARDDEYERDGQYDRDDRYGRNDGYGRNDRDDRDDDGFGDRDRDRDRDGRRDDDARRDRDRGYEEPARRGGLGGIIDRVLGSGGLRVGQRASGNLYALPSEYRNQYRDSSSSYFRTDGRQIYQIDARSDTVVRVYAMNR